MFVAQPNDVCFASVTHLHRMFASFSNAAFAFCSRANVNPPSVHITCLWHVLTNPYIWQHCGKSDVEHYEWQWEYEKVKVMKRPHIFSRIGNEGRRVIWSHSGHLASTKIVVPIIEKLGVKINHFRPL